MNDFYGYPMPTEDFLREVGMMTFDNHSHLEEGASIALERGCRALALLAIGGNPNTSIRLGHWPELTAEQVILQLSPRLIGTFLSDPTTAHLIDENSMEFASWINKPENTEASRHFIIALMRVAGQETQGSSLPDIETLLTAQNTLKWIDANSKRFPLDDETQLILHDLTMRFRPDPEPLWIGPPKLTDAEKDEGYDSFEAIMRKVAAFNSNTTPQPSRRRKRTK